MCLILASTRNLKKAIKVKKFAVSLLKRLCYTYGSYYFMLPHRIYINMLNRHVDL